MMFLYFGLLLSAIVMGDGGSIDDISFIKEVVIWIDMDLIEVEEAIQETRSDLALGNSC